MKYTHVFYGNQHIAKFTADGKRFSKWQIFCYKTKKWYKRTLLVGALVSSIGWSFAFGTMTKMAAADSKVIYVQSTSTPAVMARIAKCESGGSQYNKSGQVLININTNGTTDIGLYQINSVHNAQATKLGYDLTKKSDNEAYAMYLYETQGTGDWISSAKCWQ
jgi:hypothetical protein